ncbi:UDP-N-acetylmuramate dehydrogenase [Kitasatospora sp. NPDC057500]|uniref:UDP-N-acetylmuramate dehydrogenase n=1 Tax=Kitasatospora sp. NPDC057500 TaxID=3346151 RepID=UPI00369EF74E
MHVRSQVPLAPLTTLGVGGAAESLIEVTELDHVSAAFDQIRRRGIRPLVLGSGSNVLVADTGCPGVVLRMATHGVGLHREPDGESVLVTVEAGHQLQDLVELTIAEGLTGMETLIGIPGTVGATPVQNVGAYGQEVADTLVRVEAWDWETDRLVRLSAAACGLGHRTSIFKRSTRWTLVRAVFRLHRSRLSTPITYGMVAERLGIAKGQRVPLAEAAAAVLAVRRSKGMVLTPGDPDDRSAGSVFLSPAIDADLAQRLRAGHAPVNEFPDGSIRVSASWLIKEAGFSLGQRVADGVRLSSRHYTLVTENGATAAAFAAGAERLALEVEKVTGVRLTPEPDLFGDEPVYTRLVEAMQVQRPSNTAAYAAG